MSCSLPESEDATLTPRSTARVMKTNRYIRRLYSLMITTRIRTRTLNPGRSTEKPLILTDTRSSNKRRSVWKTTRWRSCSVFRCSWRKTEKRRKEADSSARRQWRPLSPNTLTTKSSATSPFLVVTDSFSKLTRLGSRPNGSGRTGSGRF